MKPSWDDAPEWANFLAQDPDGYWYWHEDKPEWNDGEWHSRRQWVEAGYSMPSTLERRP